MPYKVTVYAFGRSHVAWHCTSCMSVCPPVKMQLKELWMSGLATLISTSTSYITEENWKPLKVETEKVSEVSRPNYT